MFVFKDIEVLSADINLGEEDSHPTKWEIKYSDPTSKGFRYASAWFHAAGEGIQVSVFLAAFLHQADGDSTQSNISGALQDDAYALEPLYAKAKSTARILVALTESDFEIPKSMPQPEITSFAEIAE